MSQITPPEERVATLLRPSVLPPVEVTRRRVRATSLSTVA